MTAAAKQKIRDLSESVAKNAPMIRRNAEKKGTKSNAAVVHSVAKYYDALKKLESE